MKDKNTNKNPVGLLLALLALLFIIIAIIIILRARQGEELPAASPELSEMTEASAPLPSAAPSPIPVPTPTPTPTPTPSPTPTPEPSPTAQESEAPTVQPGEEPVPVEEIDASGSLRSDTNTAMNIVADWSASSTDDGNIKLEVILYVESMSLNLSSLYNGAVITINGEEFTLTTPVIKVTANEQKKSELCRTHIKLPYTEGGMSIPIKAVWNYNGVYSGVELKKLELSGEALIS